MVYRRQADAITMLLSLSRFKYKKVLRRHDRQWSQHFSHWRYSVLATRLKKRDLKSLTKYAEPTINNPRWTDGSRHSVEREDNDYPIVHQHGHDQLRPMCYRHRTGLISLSTQYLSNTLFMQVLGVDITELPKTDSGNQYIFIFEDLLTKWPFEFRMPDQKASRIAKLLV